jgi:hypothetical protein
MFKKYMRVICFDWLAVVNVVTHLQIIIKGRQILNMFINRQLLGILRHRWEDNVKIHVTETGWEGMVGIYFAENRGQCFFFVWRC